jgi:hypothetical protein
MKAGLRKSGPLGAIAILGDQQDAAIERRGCNDMGKAIWQMMVRSDDAGGMLGRNARTLLLPKPRRARELVSYGKQILSY